MCIETMMNIIRSSRGLEHEAHWDKSPMFSIVTVCYNVKEKLEYTINSVLSQQFNNFEYIIVDGASQDGTHQLLEKLQSNDKIKIICESDKGLYDAMNKGILASRGQYIIFMNAGDGFDSERVLKDVSGVCTDAPRIYYGVSKAVYPNGRIRSNRIFVRKHKNMLYDVFDGKMPNHQAIIASRECFENNLFSVDYSIGADYGWFAECIKRGIVAIPIDFCIARFEVGGRSSRPTSRMSMRREYESILRHKFPVRYRCYRFWNPR